jgi:peptide deformylase
VIRTVLKMGDPILAQIAQPVEAFDTPALHALLEDMMDTMLALNGAGIAAPQIGVSQRVVIFGFEKNQRYPEAAPVPMTVLINPIITPLSLDKENGWEGCLSVPGLRGVVPRFTKIRYQGYGPAGELIDRVAQGFHARVVQHECDHLDGKLYPQRIEDMSQFGFTEVLFPELAGQADD